MHHASSLSAPTLPADMEGKLRAYAGLLGKWNRTINLVSRADADELWGRHVLDSLRLLPLIPPDAGRGIDLGSGAGLPGLVLALASGLPFDLIEADRRKAAFLAEAQRITAAPIQVHCARIETARVPPAPLLTARALAPLPALLALAHPLLQPGGTCLFPKGARVQDELAEARLQWRFHARIEQSPLDPASNILVITDLARA